MPTRTAREAVAVFDKPADLQAAIDELLSAGFDRAQLSLLADEKTVDEKLGHIYKRTEELEDEPKAATAAYISTESRGDAEGALIGTPLYVAAGVAVGAVIASGGTLGAAILTAIAAGAAGGTVGAVLAEMLEDRHAHYLQEQLAHGGLLLWVNTPDAAHEDKAKAILAKHSAHDVHVHDLAAPA